MPEVVGDAGLLVAPNDVTALSANLDRLLKDAGLQAELSERGRARAAAFTWEATAQATLECYQCALKVDSDIAER